MDFRIADTFTASLARLTGEEQKGVKTTAFDLQLDPSNPAMQFHKLSKPKDPNFWSVRVNSDIRLIVHRTASSLMLSSIITMRRTPGRSGGKSSAIRPPGPRSSSRCARAFGRSSCHAMSTRLL